MIVSTPPAPLAFILALGLNAAPAVAASAADADEASTVPTYTEQIQPIFNGRCIACHGCLGSPCNVKLDSFQGVERGGFGLNAYSSHFDDWINARNFETRGDTAGWLDLTYHDAPER